MREKIGIVSSEGEKGNDIIALPLDWICRELVHSKEEEGTNVAVVEAAVIEEYSDGVYLEESTCRRGICSIDMLVLESAGILNVSFGIA